MSRISIKAILVGGLVDVVSSFVLAIPIAVIAASRGIELNVNHQLRPIEMTVGIRSLLSNLC